MDVARKVPVVAAVAVVALCVWGFVRLFQLRFEAGDVYPAYSSLRADPLGVRALHDSLAGYPTLTVERNFRLPLKLEADRGTTLIVGGLSLSDLMWIPDVEYRWMQGFAVSGGRLVLGLESPGARRTWLPDDEENEEDEAPPEDKQKPPPKGDGKKPEKKAAAAKPATNAAPEQTVWTNRLGFCVKRDAATGLRLHAVRAGEGGGPPAQVPWREGYHFAALSNEWRTVYRTGEGPVIVERRWGKGSIVVALDSYLISNEALWRDRQPGLSWPGWWAAAGGWCSTNTTSGLRSSRAWRRSSAATACTASCSGRSCSPRSTCGARRRRSCRRPPSPRPRRRRGRDRPRRHERAGEFAAAPRGAGGRVARVHPDLEPDLRGFRRGCAAEDADSRSAGRRG